MSRSQRLKGAAFEREIAAALTAALGVPVRRNLGQARDSGDDITFGKVRIECKRRAKVACYEWIDQVQAACNDGERGIVVFRADGRQAHAIVPLADMITLLRLELER